MKEEWIRIIDESSSDTSKSVQIQLTTREAKLIQNYLKKGKALNDPSNKECLKLVIRILQDIVDDSQVGDVELDVANYLLEKFGIQTEIDPFGERTGIELSDNGLIELTANGNKDFAKGGKYADAVQGGFWDDQGNLTNGFVSVEDLNDILEMERIDGSDVDSIKLEKEGNLVKIMLDL